MNDKCPKCGGEELTAGFAHKFNCPELLSGCCVTFAGPKCPDCDNLRRQLAAAEAKNAKLLKAIKKVSAELRTTLREEDKTDGYMELHEDWLMSIAVVLEAAEDAAAVCISRVLSLVIWLADKIVRIR